MKWVEKEVTYPTPWRLRFAWFPYTYLGTDQDGNTAYGWLVWYEECYTSDRGVSRRFVGDPHVYLAEIPEEA